MGLFTPRAAKIRARFKEYLEDRKMFNSICRLGDSHDRMAAEARESAVDMVSQKIRERLAIAGGVAATLGASLLMMPYALQVNTQDWVTEQALKLHAAMPDVSQQVVTTMVEKAHPLVEAMANLNHSHLIAGGVYASLALLPAAAGMLLASKGSFQKTAERQVSKALKDENPATGYAPDADAIAPAV